MGWCPFFFCWLFYPGQWQTHLSEPGGSIHLPAPLRWWAWLFIALSILAGWCAPGKKSLLAGKIKPAPLLIRNKVKYERTNTACLESYHPAADKDYSCRHMVCYGYSCNRQHRDRSPVVWACAGCIERWICILDAGICFCAAVWAGILRVVLLVRRLSRPGWVGHH